ncbi:hypothetical protein HMPREF3156_02660 [Neisseria sp. HMSC06F02]|nr:hypothetical protein HMPREF3156_02660 [Neisseria sp. HMSC06F02]
MKSARLHAAQNNAAVCGRIRIKKAIKNNAAEHSVRRRSPDGTGPA